MLHLRKVVALRETANEALLRSGRFMVIFRPFSKVRSLKCFFLYYYYLFYYFNGGSFKCCCQLRREKEVTPSQTRCQALSGHLLDALKAFKSQLQSAAF